MIPNPIDSRNAPFLCTCTVYYNIVHGQKYNTLKEIQQNEMYFISVYIKKRALSEQNT